MDDLSLFRTFRSGVAAPSEDARRRASARLTSAIEGQRWRGTTLLRPIRRRPGRAVLVMAALVGATAAALFISTPWQSSPRLGFLDEVQAAIAPQAGTVLHLKLVMTAEYTECSVTHPPIEAWVDLAPPYNWRAFDVKQTDLCTAGTSVEIGGQTTSGKVLGFLPPNTLEIRGDFAGGGPDANPDPYGRIRQAIDDGTAHLEGMTVLDDRRTVERVRIDPPERFPDSWPSYWYVDPESFLPVRTLAGPGLRPGPGASCTAPCFIQDFLTYEYLPGTPANRALADIRAQHPDAIER
jgi:hypothetical protein